MCGRYQIDSDIRTIIRRYDIESIVNDIESNLHEIKPTQYAPVIIKKDNQIEMQNFKWGFTTTYLKRPVINSRSETVFDKKMFKKAILKNRCLIPANFFYEWKNKKRYIIKVMDEKIFSMAGIFEETSSGMYTYSILTRSSVNDVAKIHDRMPVILNREKEMRWLEGIEEDEIRTMVNDCKKNFTVKAG